MSDLYKNKYRITSARLQNWDYTWNAEYFITICTHKQINYFGKIENDKMILSNVGVLANVFWYEIKNHTKNVELGEFIVMPNHVHGILILNNSNVETLPVETLPVETLHARSLHYQGEKNKFMSSISPKPNSISTIIRSYKSAVIKHANRLDFEVKWQTRFHDHIIRNSKSFDKISNYIANNPLNWRDDKFYN